MLSIAPTGSHVVLDVATRHTPIGAGDHFTLAGAVVACCRRIVDVSFRSTV